jgi:hypothetical protein
MVRSTIYSLLIPCTEIAPQTIFFTVFSRHSGKNSSPGYLLTVWTLSSCTAIVDSSLNTTWWQILALYWNGA